jgi:23S rRNA pseudouridine2605 synthase
MSVTLDGKRLEPQEQVYILMNKSKNVITSTADEHDRLTVVEILTPALERMGLGHLRIFPVGRLDRNTTGVILLTNDGELTQELTHPSREIEKIYQVRLNKPVTSEHMSMLADGIELEDGMIHCDQVAYVHELTKDEVGVQIHSGRNRIVRRMFEHLGYEVTKLDRVSFSGLTKKDLPRGKWRILKPDEVRRLKYFNKTKATTKDKK